MKIGLIVTLGFTLLFYGCGAVTPSTPVVFNTFNTSNLSFIFILVEYNQNNYMLYKELTHTDYVNFLHYRPFV